MEGLCSVTGVLPGLGHNDVVPWERVDRSAANGRGVGGKPVATNQA